MLDEQHEQEFLDRHPNATEEEINRFDSIEQFNEYQVFLDFDEEFSFNGLIHNYIVAENEWLSHNDLPDILDPDNIYFGLDENELAILNQDYAYMIDNGGKNPIIVKHYPDGVVIINDGSINTLNQISQYSQIAGNGIFVDGLTNVNVVESSSSSTNCKFWHREQDYRTLGDIRIKGVVKVKSHIELVQNVKVKTKAKTIKHHWYGWTRYRVSSIKTAVDGEAYEDSCNGTTYFFSKSRDFRERTNSSKVKFKRSGSDLGNFDALYYTDNMLWGYFYIDDNPKFKLDFYNGTYEAINN